MIAIRTSLEIKSPTNGYLHKITDTPAPKTRHDLIALLHHMLSDAQQREIISHIPKLPTVKVPTKPIIWLTAEQQDSALNHIPARHRPIFDFLRLYGCRPAEACALCWDMINIPAGEFYLARTISRRRLRDGTKTLEAVAQPIMPNFAVTLDSLPRGLKALPVFVNPEADRNRNPLGLYLPDFLNALWRPAVAAAGLQPIRLYNAFRHSLAMQALAAGVDQSALPDLLGHTSAQHTKKYARANVGVKARTLARVINADQLLTKPYITSGSND